MKPYLALLLLLPLAQAWKCLTFPHFVLNAFYRIQTSPIPQFILDAQHPWIGENRAWLERLPDAAAQLCALDSPLRPDPVISGKSSSTYPEDLFRRLEIDNNRSGVSRFGWTNAVARLEEMHRCPAALLDVAELRVDIYVHYDSPFDASQERFNPPAALPGLFSDALQAMPNLRNLSWYVASPQTQQLGRVFRERNLTLLGVRDLRLGKLSEYMVGVCPGVESLSALDSMPWRHDTPDPHLLLVHAAAAAKNITYFGMRNGFNGWDIKLLEEVIAALPNLTRLDVRGSIQAPPQYNYMEYGLQDDLGKELKEFAESLAKLSRLTDLSLPDSSRLGVGFDGGPWCGNAYDGPDGRDYYRQVMKQNAEATERAAEIVLQSPLNLTTLRIGGTRANVTIGADGRNVTWPWTGRMDKWAWEIVRYND